MALNVELIAGPGREQMPQPFDGEVFILSRDGLALEISHGPTRRPPMKGVLYVTNMRMVLVVDSKHIATAQCESMELPFQGIEEESFNQPIFGTNNLSGRCKPYDNQPFHGEIRFRLKFYEGGVGTFLPIFNSVLGATRRILYQRRQQQQQGSVQGTREISVAFCLFNAERYRARIVHQICRNKP
mmetsp:Transcript_18555/g.38958  ORF Transcript_18555/g.38958 Transcript_18555/m.38958 type:complete len:185 (-) Transcript_18555:277-831(-)